MCPERSVHPHQQYPRRDSNPHWNPFKGSVSCRLDYGGRPLEGYVASGLAPGSPASSRARARTASSMGSVSLPVKVFCWLTW